MKDEEGKRSRGLRIRGTIHRRERRERRGAREIRGWSVAEVPISRRERVTLGHGGIKGISDCETVGRTYGTMGCRTAWIQVVVGVDHPTPGLVSGVPAGQVAAA